MKKLLIGVFSACLLSQGLNAAEVEYSISVDRVVSDLDGTRKAGIGYNGKTPGETLRFKEDDTAVIHVTNNLDEPTSIHWHGLILPFSQDGVPDISFPGIQPGETFTYNFPIVQSGTYWYHSHSGFQEPDGAYGSIIIESEKREPFRYDREYVIQLADPHAHSGDRIMRNLKSSAEYYNRSQRTLGTLLDDAKSVGWSAALEDRLAWGSMKMMPTDIEDVQGFTPLINGKSTQENWTGLFKKGQRIRLRFINSSAMTYFDVRIPGLEMLVVSADGNNVQPVNVDEFRIAVSETLDVIVRPKESKAYSIIAESMGRTAMVRGTLAPSEGMIGAVPPLRAAPLLTMADMKMDGMDHGSMPGMDHGSMSGMSHGSMAGMDHSSMSGMNHGSMAGMDHSSMSGMNHGSVDTSSNVGRYYAKGSGLDPINSSGGKFLQYSDLKAQKPIYKDREATREIELRLTGNMERYVWSINGKKYADAEPIRLKLGERVRFKFVNETMMAHPMHLHGMWMLLDNGQGAFDPIKHVLSVAPNTTVYAETEVDSPGQWAFHCHLSYHAGSGMFRKVVVDDFSISGVQR
ncbi:MAG: copper resistance system multicopper oxidase [Gammaproteobacteria bacterium]